MKFLVFALCVCAASAASARSFSRQPWQQGQQTVQAVAQTFVPVSPVETIAPVANTNTKTLTSYKQGEDALAQIVRSDSDVTAEGFQFAYETANGIAAQSHGSLKKVDNVDVLGIEGSYQYTNPDGTLVQFTYTADENGFHPRSDSLPVGPPVPKEIALALEYIAAHPPKPENL